MEATNEVVLSKLSRFMQDVTDYRQVLSNLGEKWNMLSVMGQISGTGTDMGNTREGFQELTHRLLHHLTLEMVKKTAQEMVSKAQVTVDVLIRNLFERTADIGFLATDDDIREFLNAIASSTALAPQSKVVQDPKGPFEDRQLEDKRAALENRFREYVAKYSVYFDIILLDTSGRVLARLDDQNTVFVTKDPLVSQALSTSGEYVELYRHCDLLPDQDESLIYAFRVTQTNESRSKPIGVLCLCFRFEDEMEGIFASLINENDWSVLLLLDESGSVMASSDPYQVPVGAPAPMVPDEPYRVIRFGGREYLAKTCSTRGYQNFFGLGWYGHVMVPLDQAFGTSGADNLGSQIDTLVLEAIMSAPRLFSDELRTIPKQANRIQEELDLTIWNGNVHETGANSKLVLQQISHAGTQTKQVFEDSINNLHKTVISAILNDAEFQAALAVDLMDRNLYERANDARWWALTSAFRKTLSQPSLSSGDTKAIGDILNYINCLYTVYTLLFVYDTKGKILAVSNASGIDFIGTVLDAEWVGRTLAIKNSQKYSVSRFEHTHLYQDRHTYIYGASITQPGRTDAVVGGIGIVFDSEPQFKAMLEDSLPRDDRGQIQEGCFGIFADPGGTIVSTTHTAYPVGSQLSIDKTFLNLNNGQGTSGIIAHDGQYYAVGARASSGYREYKIHDEYKNDIVGLVFVPLAEVHENTAAGISGSRKINIDGFSAKKVAGANQSVATFYIGEKCFGFFTSQVVEAVHVDHITARRATDAFAAGTFLFEDELIRIFDVGCELGCRPDVDTAASGLAVVVQVEGERFAIQVDMLGEIAEVGADQLESAAATMEDEKHYIDCFVKPANQDRNAKMAVVLNPAQLLKCLG